MDVRVSRGRRRRTKFPWDVLRGTSSPLFKVPAIYIRLNYRMNFSSELQSALNNVIAVCVTPKRRCIRDTAKISLQRSWEWRRIPRSMRVSIATVRVGSSTLWLRWDFSCVVVSHVAVVIIAEGERGKY